MRYSPGCRVQESPAATSQDKEDYEVRRGCEGKGGLCASLCTFVAVSYV